MPLKKGTSVATMHRLKKKCGGRVPRNLLCRRLVKGEGKERKTMISTQVTKFVILIKRNVVVLAFVLSFAVKKYEIITFVRVDSERKRNAVSANT